FCTLAGGLDSCGPQPPSTLPVSRSATSHELAVRTAGSGGAAGGSVSPAVSSPSPPIVGRVTSCGGGDGLGGVGIDWATTGHGKYGGAVTPVVAGAAGVAGARATGRPAGAR